MFLADVHSSLASTEITSVQSRDDDDSLSKPPSRPHELIDHEDPAAVPKPRIDGSLVLIVLERTHLFHKASLMYHSDRMMQVDQGEKIPDLSTGFTNVKAGAIVPAYGHEEVAE